MTISVTTAPRNIPTIEKSILSLRYSGFKQQLHIFSEPYSPQPKKDKNYIWHNNPKTKGCFNNFHDSIGWLLENTQDQYYMLCQDDVVYQRHIKKYIRDIKGVQTFYLATEWGNNLDKPKGWHLYDQPDNHICFWGACCYVIDRTTLEHIFTHPSFKAHLIHANNPENKKCDCIVNTICSADKIPFYYHSPSLTDHIGKTSTLRHIIGHVNKGYKFCF